MREMWAVIKPIFRGDFLPGMAMQAGKLWRSTRRPVHAVRLGRITFLQSERAAAHLADSVFRVVIAGSLCRNGSCDRGLRAPAGAGIEAV